MKALSLFSGIGGIDLAGEWAGIETVAFCERDPFCQKVLKKHWPSVPCFDDVTTLKGSDIGTVDLIHGGVPCQDISIAGRKAGLAGGRSGLWGEYARLIGELRPAWVLVENVRRLVSDGLDRVLSDLAGMGYDAEWGILSACSVGAPHMRKRVFIVAYPAIFGSDRGRQAGTIAPVLEYAGLGTKYSRPWETQPRPVGVVDGVSRKLDGNRIGALGNAVVPQQVYPILKAIKEIHDMSQKPLANQLADSSCAAPKELDLSLNLAAPGEK
jgi:DNA (cytosine-5)-methyltransferase 1